MTATVVHPDHTNTPVGSALKNLAKIHDLPPFVKLFQNARTAIIVVHRKYAEQWRAALVADDFTPDTEGITWTATAFWMGARVQITYGIHEGEPK